MKKQKKNLQKTKMDREKISVSCLEEILERLSKKVRKLAKKNGFSRDLKDKVEYELK